MFARRFFGKLRRTFSVRSDLMSHIDSTVRQIVSTQADFRVEDFDSASPFEDLHIDAFEKTRIIVEAEEFFKVDFTDDEFLGARTPFDVVVLVNKHVSKEYSLRHLDESRAARDDT